MKGRLLTSSFGAHSLARGPLATVLNEFREDLWKQKFLLSSRSLVFPIYYMQHIVPAKGKNLTAIFCVNLIGKKRVLTFIICAHLTCISRSPPCNNATIRIAGGYLLSRKPTGRSCVRTFSLAANPPWFSKL